MKVLVWEATQEEVQEGAPLIDFRGEEWSFICLTRAGRRVYAKRQKNGGTWAQEFFPAVFDGVRVIDR